MNVEDPTTTALTVASSGSTDLAAPLDAERVEAERLSKPSRSDATVTAYKNDWGRWEGFCAELQLSTFLEVDEVEDVIVRHLARLKAGGLGHATILRAYAAIRSAYRDEGRALPTLPKVVNALHNIGRELGTAPHGKTPLSAEQLKSIARLYDEMADDMKRVPVERVLAVRDASMLLLGFAAARRREEIVAFDHADVRFVEDGLIATVGRSKTDQLAEGYDVGVALGSSRATCPARALRRWLEHAGITEGPVYRGVDRSGRVLPERLSPEGVARAVKRAVALLGLDPKEYAGHSLRSGFATTAAETGKSMASIMRQGAWRSDRTVRERYIKPATLFKDNASEGLL